MARNILLSIVGINPQIITETLYGLYKNSFKNFPEEIYVITTELGLINLRKKCFGEESIISNFCKEYNLKNIDFSEEKNVFCIQDDNNDDGSLENFKNTQDSISDFIFKKVSEFTNKKDEFGNPYYRIHASIAGGRKNLSYFFGIAMSILANKDDELSHVLIPKCFENSSFCYPTIESNIIKNAFKEEVDTKNAKVALIPIPLLRLRNVYERSDIFNSSSTLSYKEIVEKLNRELSIEPSKFNITFDRTKSEVIINNVYCIPLDSAEFAFYSLIAKNTKSYNKGKGEALVYKPSLKDYSNEKKKIEKDFDKEYLSKSPSPINHNGETYKDSLNKEKNGKIDQLNRRTLNNVIDGFLQFLENAPCVNQNELRNKLKKYKDRYVVLESLVNEINDLLINVGKKSILQDGDKSRSFYSESSEDVKDIIQSHRGLWERLIKDVGNRLKKHIDVTSVLEFFVIKDASKNSGIYILKVDPCNIEFKG